MHGLYSKQKQDYYGLVSDGITCCTVLLKNGDLIKGAFRKLSADVLDELVRVIILLEKVALTPQNLVRDFSQGENPISRRLSKNTFQCIEKLSYRAFNNLYKKVKDPNLVGSFSGHTEGSRAFARYRTIDDDMKKELVGLLE